MDHTRRAQALRLFRSSVLKQAKLRAILSFLGDTRGMVCLDVGGDNGIISLLLRERGGTWHSADLGASSIAAIRALVGDNVHQLEGPGLPFADSGFDRVVVVDYMEHIHEDREFARELRRILKPDGVLVVNVPHIKPGSLLKRLQQAIGQTDELHGHVRPGYSEAGLADTLRPWFAIREARTYSGTFSELIDTGLRFAIDRSKGGGRQRQGAHKGNIVTQADLDGRKLAFRLLALCYPLLWLFSRLDYLLFLQRGYKLIVKADVSGSSQGGDRP